MGCDKESLYWLDVEAFGDGVSSVLAQPYQNAEDTHITNLVHALGLYSGDLLEGLYKDWVLRERERLRNLYLRGLST